MQGRNAKACKKLKSHDSFLPGSCLPTKKSHREISIFYIYFWNGWKKKLVFQHTINLPWEIGRQILTQRPKTSHSKRHAPLEIFLAGPYGAPASGLFYRQVDHAVLIATGIGVTPFASILQSIMFKFGESRRRLQIISISQS